MALAELDILNFIAMQAVNSLHQLRQVQYLGLLWVLKVVHHSWVLDRAASVNLYFQAAADFQHRYTLDNVVAAGGAQLD